MTMHFIVIKLSGSNVDDDILPDNFVQLPTRVLGDAFHVMDRIKVPMHHDFKQKTRALLSAVEYVPNIQQNLPINDEYRNPVRARDLPNPCTSTTANITELGITQQIQRKKRKSCDTPGCVEKYGDTCPKKYSRRCKLLEEQGVTFEKLKRKAHIRSYANPNCFDLNCKATNNRTRCIALLNENTS